MQPAQPRVSFLIVGTQKGGTTALHSMLQAVPDLYLPPEKELHFFDKDADRSGKVDWSCPDHAGYEAQFSAAGNDQICGEATPIYMFYPHSLARIHAYHPAMKLVAILRQPAERAWSHWRMEMTRGKDTMPFSQAIREGRSRVAQNLRTFSYVERGYYSQQIRAMLDLFPRAQCHFLLDEDLRHKTDAALQDLCRFLGATPPAAPIRAKVAYFRSDPALTRPDPGDLAYLNALYRDDIADTDALIGRDLSHWRNQPAPN